jgi:DNA-directed RNA polymerase alpha subunit
MSERETIDKIKSKQGILDRIQNFFTLGYGTKEDLREIDKKLRDLMYEDFRNIRHKWEDIYLEALNQNVSTPSSKFKKIIQLLDRIMEKVRHADYGYAGLMDRKGHIREEELARVLNFDQTLNKNVEEIKQTVTQTYNNMEDENWTTVPAEIKKIQGLLMDFEDKLQQRKESFRPIEN